MYILDIDEIRSIADSIGSKTSNPDEQFERLNFMLYEKYRIDLPKGLKKASLEKFKDIISSPLVYERAVVPDHQDCPIQKNWYSLLTSLLSASTS